MPDASKHLEKAQRYYEKGKLEDALEEYLFALKEDPNNYGLVQIIAEIYLRQNQVQKAMECFGYLFDKYAGKKDGPTAVLMYRKMARLGLHDPGRMLLCARFQEKQKPEDARDFYRHAAQLFLERGEKPQALEALRGLAGLEKGNPEAHVRVAELAESLGQNEVAGRAFASAGQMLTAGSPTEGSLRGAVVLLERAHALLPDDTAITVRLASSLLGVGNGARSAELLQPLGADVAERNRLLADACLAIGKLDRAEEVLWEMAARAPEAHSSLLRVLDGYIAAGDAENIGKLLRRLKQAMFAASKEQEFLGWVESTQQKNPASIAVADFLASLYVDLSQESKAAATLGLLFDRCVEAGEHPKAAGVLERLVELAPNDAENKSRLERLAGKLDAPSYQVLEARVLHKPPPAGTMGGPPAGGSLEEMVLQAEMLLQFGTKESAIEYLKQATQQFPGAENTDERLQSLLVACGLMAKPAAPPPAPAGRAEKPAAHSTEESTADLTAVAVLARSLHRQTTIKGVLSTIVSEIGKTWKASRCVAGLGAPGKSPSAALEFCAPEMKPSDGMSLGKLVASLSQFTMNGEPLAIEDVASSSQLSQLSSVIQALGVRSLLALPLMDADQPAGVVVLQQCDRSRRWRPNEIIAVKAIVDQMMISISHIKLRSLMKAVSDESSGLLNRSSYLDCLMAEISRAQKQSMPLSVALLQMECEQPAIRELGDNHIQQFMQQAAQVLVSNLRQNDIGVRYDSTTLALVLPGTRGKDSISVVDKIRKVLGGMKVANSVSPPMSVGIAEAVVDGKIDAADSVTELINRLVAALETAQKEGCGNKLLLPPGAAS